MKAFLIVFRHLCLLLNAKDVYCALSEILQQEEDLQFASLMVNNLNMILLTSSELFDLRQKLKDLENEVCSHVIDIQGNAKKRKIKRQTDQRIERNFSHLHTELCHSNVTNKYEIVQYARAKHNFKCFYFLVVLLCASAALRCFVYLSLRRVMLSIF